jgi:hypothetical protein
VAQRRRGKLKKLELLRLKGGRCSRCGYSTNLAALEFHHPDAAQKEFQLDLRSLANRNWVESVTEAAKCVLLCSNCHAEVHDPEYTLAR